MIIYRENIGKFISQCFDGSAVLNIGSIISKQMRLKGITYFGESQVNAWNASLPEMAQVLMESDVDRNIDVAVEYDNVSSIQIVQSGITRFVAIVSLDGQMAIRIWAFMGSSEKYSWKIVNPNCFIVLKTLWTKH